MEKTHKKHVKRRPTLLFWLLIAMLALLALDFFLFVNYADQEKAKVNTKVTTECGYPVSLDMFFNAEPDFPDLVSCNLDFDTIDTTAPQTVQFTIRIWKYAVRCELEITDTIAPIGTAVPQEMFSVDEIPDASEVVTDVYDLNDVTISYVTEPDISEGGLIEVPVSLKDSSGNVTIIYVPFDVTKDGVAPVIVGATDLHVYIGDTISYRANIKVRDVYDPDPTLTVDTSAVDLTTEGEYPVTYTATDFSGNTSSRTVTLTVEKKPKGYIEPEVLDELCAKLLDEITTDDMSDMEVALQIVYWCRYNIHYGTNSVLTSRRAAAYQGLTQRSGKCYTYAMTVKALLDYAGIENMIIRRENFIHSAHFWNYIKIDGEWYHCDATPRKNYNSYIFMYTTKELQAFFVDNFNGYNYTVANYPESATESVQSMIDYSHHKLKTTD